jgi:hypothetical protein
LDRGGKRGGGERKERGIGVSYEDIAAARGSKTKRVQERHVLRINKGASRRAVRSGSLFFHRSFNVPLIRRVAL